VTYEEDHPPERSVDLFAHMRPFTCSCECGQEVSVPGFAPGHGQKALTREITAIFGRVEIFVACVRRPEYRKAIEQMVDEMRREQQPSDEELAREAEDYQFERCDHELYRKDSQ
jgi:hypothetical protein